MQTIKKLLFLLERDERKKLNLIILLVTIMAIFETTGVASILPFMAILTNPEVIQTNYFLKKTYLFLSNYGVDNTRDFLFVTGFVVLALFVTTTFLRTITIYLIAKFSKMNEYKISKRLIERYLLQPYNWFLVRNSADLGKTILSEVEQVITNSYKSAIMLLSRCIVVVALVCLLIFVNTKLTISIILVLSLTYVIIYFFCHNILKRIGKERLKNNLMRFKAVSESFGAIKEIKFLGLEKIYTQNFNKPANNFAKNQITSETISQLPRYGIEAVAFGGAISLVLYLISKNQSIDNVLPIISLYVFASYRLLPAVQGIYFNIANIKFSSASLDNLVKEFKNLQTSDLSLSQTPVSFKQGIKMNNVHFSYSNDHNYILKNINFFFPVNSNTGIIGTTGSGKTTIIDIILGLLEPQKGTLEIDNKIITRSNVRSWQKLIGYVPQHIYLCDDTIASNIAFGVNKNDIDFNIIKKVSKIASLDNFIVSELPNQYLTNVGERGVKLSGGQRQRIGIARALYHNPDLLILDEATSALDDDTEKVVMEAVDNLSKKMTIILIAHRLNTIKKCDIVYKLENGIIVGQGKPSEVL